jgi:two-component system, LytTR family, sensor histidine kinase AgrC
MDNILKLLVYGISCVVGMIIIFDFMEKMYQPQYSSKAIYNIARVVLVVLWFSVDLLGLPILNFSCLTISTLSIGFFLYQAKHKWAVIQNVFLVVSYAFCDAIISSIISIVTKSSIPIYGNNAIIFSLNAVLSETMMLVIYKILIQMLKKHDVTYLSKRQFVFLSIFPILNIMVIYVITILAAYSLNKNTTHYIMMLMATISAMLSLAIIYFFEYVSKANKLENEITLIQQQAEMQYNYYHQLEVKYEQSQNIMHDIKNHIGLLEQLYKSESNEIGLSYTQKMYAKINELAMKFKSQNRILDIIVNDKIKLCEISGIEFTYAVENFDINFINEIDITTIFANLLDNAIEACERIREGEKSIELRIFRFHDMLIINIINSVATPPLLQNDKFISSKKEHQAIGLSNVKRTVNKYSGGDINFKVEQKKFVVSIMFPI